MKERVIIVVIDDNAGSLELLSEALAREGVEVLTAATPVHGLELIRRHRPRLVLTDLVMPGMTGLEVLDEITAFDPSIDVILMTAHYTSETAVAAIRAGAADYLPKPVKLGVLRERVAGLLAAAERRKRARVGAELEYEGLVARSDVMWDLFAMIERVAPHFRSVLVNGPTGSGKDLVAQALHLRSGSRGRLVVLNCSAVVETLFESELFGHVRGSFTGADRDKTGLVELANGGTLFLDEIGDMPLGTQAKLLRVIQNQELLPVGGLTPKKISVRIVAATHRDLKAAIDTGHFREDLYYRLSMVELRVPALREHREDIVLLARHFARRFATEFAKPIDGLTPRATLALERYSWPGNVRELEHAIGRAAMLTEGRMIDIDSLPERLLHRADAMGYPRDGDGRTEHDLTLDEQERRLVSQVLAETAGNQSEAARRLGIGRDALRYKMKRFELL